MTLDAHRRSRMDPLEPFIEGCTGKVRYSTRAFAKSVIRKQKTKGMHVKLKTYRCENCGKIHLTSHPKAGRMGE